MKAPSPPTRRRTPGNSPNNSGSFHFPRSGSPVSEVSNDFKRKVEKAMRARLYLLQQTGPNSFLIGGDSPDHKFRVMIGPQVSCSRERKIIIVKMIMMMSISIIIVVIIICCCWCDNTVHCTVFLFAVNYNYTVFVLNQNWVKVKLMSLASLIFNIPFFC